MTTPLPAAGQAVRGWEESAVDGGRHLAVAEFDGEDGGQAEADLGGMAAGVDGAGVP
ncbi:hypothetical protein [Streptomyces eurocidicus]|uniref:Uncharacterized protein n=1 Tax=Streptomyces eurocidicus TaxID=66423 RepID=A0A7W8B8V8_STREU|nr:hypothetical protein [Streptomyces eurocidicus]MBB5118950.1 hypothetical protein [Streptomyces eurocidicus]MBF6051245.1 hypothetical protein [Streptomyces eurocidicus]